MQARLILFLHPSESHGGEFAVLRTTIRLLTATFVVWFAMAVVPAGADEGTSPHPQFDATRSEESLLDSARQELERAEPRPEKTPSAGPSWKTSWKTRGRIQVDAISSSQSAANRATFGDLEDVVGLRRARIGIEGPLLNDSRFLGEIDLASGRVVVRDLFIASGEPDVGGELRLGHFREPFSLEGYMSANSMEFLERSPINTLDPARNWGIGHFRCGVNQNYTSAIGLFHSGTDTSDFQGGDGAETAITARGTVLPWDDDDQLVHFGLVGSARIPDTGIVKVNQPPNSPLLDFGDSSTSPFVPTIRVPAHSQWLLNTQWAWQRGPSIVQAEWYATWIDQTGGGTVFLQGAYIQSCYFITGERRAYQKHYGTFGGVKVDRPVTRLFHDKTAPEGLGYGAWEMTARFSYLDFLDNDIPPGSQGQKVGVKLPLVTVGANWYLADRLRLMFNYSYAWPTEPNTGQSGANLFSTRLAMYW